MPRNRLRNETVAAGPVLRIVVVTGMLALVGLAYVNCKNRVHHLCQQRSKLETQKADLVAQLDDEKQKVNRMGSRVELQRKLEQGFIKLVPIQDDRIVRLRLPSPWPGELRAVSNGEGPP